MFKAIFSFELRQQLKGPLLWTFVAIFFGGALALVSSPAVKIGSAVGNVHINAPIVITNLSVMFAFLGTLFVVVFVAGALLRDFEQGTAETLFSTPVSRGAYLGGRVAAGFLIVLLVIGAAQLGALAGTLMPWVDAARVGPTTAGPWLWNFGVILVPDVLFVTALLFALAAGTRSLLATFVGVIALVVLRSVANALMSDIDSHTLAALLDPYGAQAVGAATRYWTAHAYNAQLPPLDGILLWNRLLWLAVTAALFATGFALFRTRREGVRLAWPRRRARTAGAAGAAPRTLTLPTPTMHTGLRAQWRQMLAVAGMDLRNTMRGVLFITMLLLSLALLVAVLLLSGKIYGTPVYPVTHLMVTDIRSAFSLFLLIVLAFYAGELVWRERTLKAHEVGDALPVPDWSVLAGKALALAAVSVVFLGVGALFTIGFQLVHGYTHLQPGLYLTGLSLAAIGFIQIGVLALVLQVLANNKYVGYLLFVLFLGLMGVMAYLDLDHNLYQYAASPSAPYSDLNGYGHFLPGVLWFDLYWTLFAVALLVLARLFRWRGTDRGGRWRHARSRLARRPVWTTLAVSLLAFALVGGWIFYNTNVLNHYVSGDQTKQRQADYEKRYGKFADAPQPRITKVATRVDIHPHHRKLHVHATYRLVNKHAKPIDTLYINWDQDIPPTDLHFGKHKLVKRDERVGFSIYRLAQPLQPGASMDFSFDLDYTGRGFRNEPGGMDFLLVHNGTFINNRQLFPSFGYNAQFQLTDKKDRRKYGLDPDVPRMPPLSDDPAKRANTYIANDADWISLDSVVSTAADQTALAPGDLMKTWEKDGRRYFHYKTHSPILNFFVYLSGTWKVRHAHWKDVDISVLYNPAHAWNVDDMIDSVKASLDYYTTRYTPYQFKYLRIVEFPGYRSFAQSFAGTIPFSESIGFIADVGGKDDIDYPFYVTAHEVAHQWWAHQVIGANMQGATMLSESLAQYSALMVMKRRYGARAMRKFLKYELDTYLTGRVTDSVGETPLGKVEGQTYIRYNKASAIFYALQDYIGEDVIDGVLKGFLQAKGFQQPPYTTSREFVDALRAGTGGKWNALIDDSFWKITLYDNRVTSATAKRQPDGRYRVTMKVHAAKYHADDKGKQTRARMDIPVEIGVFGKPPGGVEADQKILHLEKRRVEDGDSTLTFTVDGKPWEVGIDPYNELVDRNTSDNRKQVVLE